MGLEIRKFFGRLLFAQKIDYFPNIQKIQNTLI